MPDQSYVESPELTAARQEVIEAQLIAERPLPGENRYLLALAAQAAYDKWLDACEAEYRILDSAAGLAEVEQDRTESAQRARHYSTRYLEGAHRDRTVVVAMPRTSPRARARRPRTVSRSSSRSGDSGDDSPPRSERVFTDGGAR